MILTNTWRDGGGGEENSQIGQLLYYMLGAVLRRIRKIMAPTGASANVSTAPILGLFMEEGVVRVCIYIHVSV